MNRIEINIQKPVIFFMLFLINIASLFLACETVKKFISSYYWANGMGYAAISDWDSSNENYNQAIRLDPNNGRLRFFYGSMLLIAGKIDEGIHQLEKSKKNFKDIYLYQNLGKSYLDKKMVKESIYHYEKILQTGIYYSTNLNNLGVVYLNSGQWDKSIEIFKQVIVIDGNNIEAHENLGLAYLNKEVFEKAVTEFEQALNLSPGRITTLNNLGVAYMKLKKYDKAIETFNKILTLDNQSTVCYNNIGNVFYLMGNNKKAITFWKKTLEIDPDNQIALHNIKKVTK